VFAFFLLSLSNYFVDQMVWTAAKKAKTVELFFRNSCSVVKAQRAYRREMHTRRVPERQNVLRWVELFRAEGTVERRTGPQRRQRPVQTEQAVAKVDRKIHANPRLSIRKLAVKTGLKKSTVQRILRQRLHMFPYKLQLVQKLRRGDKAKRLQFCKWVLQKLRRRAFRKFLFMSDEANFHLDGSVSKQNCRVWGEQNPQLTSQANSYSAYVQAWCAVSAQGIIGPFFFEEAGERVTVNGMRYRQMLEGFFLPKLQELGISAASTWFQQDNATCHTSARVIGFLEEKFPGRVISKNGSFLWPPRSPDLSIPDFFLWGHIKNEVYRTPVSTLTQLKRRIRKCIREISPDTLKATIDALLVRCRACIRRRGGHLENILGRSQTGS